MKLQEPFDYTLVLTNNGPATATGVVVTDPLPPSRSSWQERVCSS